MHTISVPGLVLALSLCLLASAAPASATSTEKPAAPAVAAPAPAKTGKTATTSSRESTRTEKKAASSETTKAKKSKKTKKSKKSTAKARKSPSALSQAAAAAAGESSDAYAGLAPCYDFQPRGRGRCEPQCIPYTRCRSGIMSCRLGHENGPLTWYACEVRRKNTSHTPEDGAVLILDRDNGHGMPTGHAIYVEHTEPDGDGGFLLTVSHSNYDRRCHLETTVLARYDPEKKTLEMRSGAWQDWGRNLKVAGFIRK